MSLGSGCPPGTSPYTVVRGDTLGSLAQRFGVTVDDIMFLNADVEPHSLPIGAELCIPTRNCSGGLMPYVIKPGDTFESVARQFRTIPRLLGHFNPGTHPHAVRPGYVLCVPAPFDDFDASRTGSTGSHATGRLRGLRPRAKGG